LVGVVNQYGIGFLLSISRYDYVTVRGGEATITGDIATIAPGTADPGTLAPIFRHNRIYLPARFLFNVFGYSADYNFERVGTRIVITPMN